MEGIFYRLVHRYAKRSSDRWIPAFAANEQPSPFDDSFGYTDLGLASHDLDTLRLSFLAGAVECAIEEVRYSITSRIMTETEHDGLGRTSR